MKTLFFIRHGKSSRDDESLSDSERPLKPRGEKDAGMMAKIIRKRGIVPEQIVSSPAKRALDTAKIFSSFLDYGKKKIEVNDLLYFGGAENIFNVIRRFDNEHKTVFIFGHNPDFTELANRFSEKKIDNVPTCGVVGVEFNVASWKDVSSSNGQLTFFDFPSNHK